VFAPPIGLGSPHPAHEPRPLVSRLRRLHSIYNIESSFARMTPQRFREIEALCQSVRQHGPEVLANVDPEIRELVQNLLEQDPRLPSNPSGAETVTQSFQAPAGIGTQLGPYKLEALLGAGGMGQVFRAVDTRLARSVAIKTSHERFTERFERE